MQRKGGVEIGLGGLNIHRDRHRLHDFTVNQCLGRQPNMPSSPDTIALL
jgi:hypothetical protein